MSEGCLLEPGSRCSYQCYAGYRPGYSDALCLSTGSWRQEEHPLCQGTKSLLFIVILQLKTKSKGHYFLFSPSNKFAATLF